uniref:Uncharacterized protein n=1 Tax=Cacopsylla melanoneura TaxID=428564 RepID=A0A8D9AGA7_9HEMI
MSIIGISLVLLTFGVLSTNCAHFTREEFADFLSHCFVDEINSNVNIQLPLEQVKENFSDFDFQNVLQSLVTPPNSVTTDSPLEAELDADNLTPISPLQTILQNCYYSYLDNKQFEPNQGSFAILYDCTCDKIKDNKDLPKLPCDEIATAAYEDKIRENSHLWTDHGFDVSRFTDHPDGEGPMDLNFYFFQWVVLKCENQIKPLLLPGKTISEEAIKKII